MKNLLFISSYPLPLNKGSNQHAYFFIKTLACKLNVYCIFFVQSENIDDFEDNIDTQTLGIKNYEICYFKKNSRKNKYYNRIRKIIEFPSSYMNLATHTQGKKIISTHINKMIFILLEINIQLILYISNISIMQNMRLFYLLILKRLLSITIYII